MGTQVKKAVFLQELTLRDVKSFKGEHHLDLTDAHGQPARWTLILGENGVGKTTLLECLAHLTPLFNSDDVDGGLDPIMFVEPALAAEANDVIFGLGRQGDIDFELKATFAVDARLGKKNVGDQTVESRVSFRRVDGEVAGLEASRWRKEDGIRQSAWDKHSPFKEPMVLAYGAGRYMGSGKPEFATAPNNTDSLLHGKVELFDAEELLLHYDYRSLRPGTKMDKFRRKQLLEILVSILPEVEDIGSFVFKGPTSRASTEGGVFVRTKDGLVPLRVLSFGYKTMMAWAGDIAWRLFERYPNSSNPFAEPAIVLIDEIDLHLHPRWQRQIRELLASCFPNTQFVATAHSPLMAQAYLDANLAVVTREDDHSVILNDPGVIATWRIDEIITSDLFGFDTAFPQAIDELFQEQKHLVGLRHRDRNQETHLREVEEKLLALPTSNRDNDAAWETVKRFAATITEGGSA